MTPLEIERLAEAIARHLAPMIVEKVRKDLDGDMVGIRRDLLTSISLSLNTAADEVARLK